MLFALLYESDRKIVLNLPKINSCRLPQKNPLSNPALEMQDLPPAHPLSSLLSER